MTGKISGEIKPSTWNRVDGHHRNHGLGAVAAVAPPRNAKLPLETLARSWTDKPGVRTRQIQIQSTVALLRWAVAERRLGEDWADGWRLVERFPTPAAMATPTGPT